MAFQVIHTILQGPNSKLKKNRGMKIKNVNLQNLKFKTHFSIFFLSLSLILSNFPILPKLHHVSFVLQTLPILHQINFVLTKLHQFSNSSQITPIISVLQTLIIYFYWFVVLCVLLFVKKMIAQGKK